MGLRERYRRWREERSTAESSNLSSPQSDCAPPVEHVQHVERANCVRPEPDQIVCAPAQDPPTGLWDRAYKSLGKHEPELVAKYEGLLFDELKTIDRTSTLDGANSTTTTNTSDKLSRERLQTIAERGLKRLDENKLKWTIAGHEIAVGDRIAQAADLVRWAKDWIDLATRASPEASIAWAGISIVLPLLTNHRTAEQANREGFTYVTTRMRYYTAFEPEVFSLAQSGDGSGELMAEVTAHIAELYEKILEFQLRSVLRLYQSRCMGLARDAVGYDDWAGWHKKITGLETVVNQDLERINAFVARGKLEDLRKQSIQSLGDMQRLLATGQEHLQVAKETLEIQTGIAKQSRTDKEERCHQLFRLTAGTKDVSYEWYKDRVEDRVKDTCQWFLEHENFKQWLEQGSGPLLVSADPGCGKSVLAKYLIDQVLPGSPNDASICYFFFKDQDQNTLSQALCALLHQLFTHKPLLIRHAMSKHAQDGRALVRNTASLWSILEDAIQDAQTGSVILVMDALDECLEPEFRDLARKLKQLHRSTRQQQSHGKLRTLLTCRPYEGILAEFRDLVDDFPFIRIPGEDESDAISREVNLVVAHRVEQLAREKELGDDVKGRLKERLLGVKHRTYLWVYLVFDFLKESDFKRTMKGVDASLAMVPENVNQAYEKILSKSHQTAMVRKALSIILVAGRPLTLSEMNIAVNTDTDASSPEALDLESEKDFQVRLRSWCGLFVSVYHGKIYFLHQTAREFLLAPSSPLTTAMPDSHWRHSVTTRGAHQALAEICVTYLELFNSPDFSPSGACADFLDYSANYWADHFREASFSGSNSILRRGVSLYDPRLESFSKWYQIYQQWHGAPPLYSLKPLHLAGYFAHEAVLRLLLDGGANIE
ncbi:ankyrin repeat protein [Chaetomium sp. MPI-SDFR-AT-0129]|nr:ankyrin repeat protein [Chaetomium sp. MPI-SDFR-AT-0129]